MKERSFTCQRDDKNDLDIWQEGHEVVFQASDYWTYGCSTRIHLSPAQVQELAKALQEFLEEVPA